MDLPLNKAEDIRGVFEYLTFVIVDLLGNFVLFSYFRYLILCNDLEPTVTACILCAHILAYP